MFFGDPAYGKLPQWARSYLNGYKEALFSGLYDHLEWRMWYKGKHVTKDQIPDGEWARVEPDKGAHYWIGTDRIFAGYDPTNDEPVWKCQICGWEGYEADLVFPSEGEDEFGQPMCPKCHSQQVETKQPISKE
jgi:hypothetical protein